MNTEDIYYQADIEDFLKKKPFIVAKGYISHGKKHFPLAEIKGVIRKITKNTVVGNIGQLSVEYKLEIGSKSGKTIDIMLLAAGSNKAETEQQYADINEAIELAYLNPKIDHYFRVLKEGGSFKIDDFEFSAKGLRLQKNRLFRKSLQFDIPWNDITTKIDKLQFLNIGSSSNSKASSHISMETEHEALELYMFVERYKEQL